MTKMTFSDDVQIPGKILPAGTYWFRLLDSESDRHIVQVFDSENRHLVTTVLAIPNYRLRPTGHTRVSFDERAAGQPQAIKAWFYPGDNVGQEFVYDKSAIMSANAAVVSTATVADNTPVAPVTPAPVTDDTQPVQATPATPIVDNSADQTPAATVTPDVTPQSTDQPVTTSPEPSTDNTDATPESLPKTGSELPLIAFFGSSALGIGAALSALRRRVS